MTDKTFQYNAQGQPQKMPGWFSWRHQTRDACDEARVKFGGRASERRDRKRREAAARDAATPIERTRAYRRATQP